MSSINKREWSRRQRARGNDHISLASDNYVHCPVIGRSKFLYENETKAKFALKFNKENGAARYYVCRGCMGYHLTSKTEDEYRTKRQSFIDQGASR